MAKDYVVKDAEGRFLFTVRAKDTKHAKQLAKRRGYTGVGIELPKKEDVGGGRATPDLQSASA